MEDGPFEMPAGDILQEILNCDRRLFLEKFQYDVSLGSLDCYHAIILLIKIYLAEI
jgi:hypothetical protein